MRVQDVGLGGMDDPAVLAWAAENDRILLSHDRSTIPDFAGQSLAAGLPMPGVFLLGDREPVRVGIDEILLLDEGSEQAEWAGLIVHLPS